MCNTTTFKGFLFILSFIGLINYSNAQSGDGDLNTAWSINVNTGPSLLWGDLSDNSDPFSKMFSDERKFSYGILGRKGLNDIFGVNLQAIFGDIKGVRDEWSNGTPTGGFISEVFFTEINANLDVDIINIFNPTERRLINPYLKGGVGLTYFRTDVTYKGVEYSSSEQSTLVFPMGGGIRIDLSRRIGITLETTLEYTMTDWFDGYSTDFSEANDWYSYTSIGLTYRFVSKQEQQWLNESVKISIDYQRKLWAESEVECLKKVQEAGVKIYRPDKTLFSAKVGKMYDKYKDNKVMYQLIQDIKGAGF